MKEKSNNKQNYVNYVIILILTIGIVLIGTKATPFYKGMCDTDSEVFQIMGRGVLEGKAMYKDLFDHKGPIVYFINATAYIISPQIGVTIIEIILAYIGAIYVYKTSKFILSEKKSLIVSIVYLIAEFREVLGGNFTEEYAVTFISMALFYMTKVVYKCEYQSKNWIIIGLTFAINFFIKPTYIAIWVAFGIVELIVFIKNKKIKELIKYIGYILLGILIITVPILIYLLANNCMKEFVDAYFIMNMKYTDATLKSRIKGCMQLMKVDMYYIFAILLPISNILLLLEKNANKRTKLFVTLFYIIAWILTFISTKKIIHYLIQLAPCIAIAMIIIIYNISKIRKNKKIEKLIKELPMNFLYVTVIVSLLVITVTVIGKNGIFSETLKDEKEFIEEVNRAKQYIKEDDEILYLGNMSGTYKILGKQPKFKYFFQTPIIGYDKDIKLETKKYIQENKPNIIIEDNDTKKYYRFYGEIIDYINENYELKEEGIVKVHVLKEQN